MSPCTISNCFGCQGFPCEDVNHDLYCLPAIMLDPVAIRLVLGLPMGGDLEYTAQNTLLQSLAGQLALD